MSYIGNTRIKKIKKLFYLSTEIIRSFGLKYFFYILKLELKKQKLSMFRPDETPEPAFLQQDFQKKYDEYLSNMEHYLSKELSQKSDFKSTLDIIIIFDGDLKKTFIQCAGRQRISPLVAWVIRPIQCDELACLEVDLVFFRPSKAQCFGVGQLHGYLIDFHLYDIFRHNDTRVSAFKLVESERTGILPGFYLK